MLLYSFGTVEVGEICIIACMHANGGRAVSWLPIFLPSRDVISATSISPEPRMLPGVTRRHLFNAAASHFREDAAEASLPLSSGPSKQGGAWETRINGMII